MTDPDRTPWLIPSDDFALFDALALLRASFRFMDARIDPPSTIHNLTLEGMRAHCLDGGEIWAVGRPLFACMFLTPKSESLYVGKLAVKEELRGQGICRTLVGHAASRAADLGLPALELETRVELTENHRVFSRLGFTIVGTGSHEGYDRPTDFLLRKPISLSADS